jgi:hypothetical protein
LAWLGHTKNPWLGLTARKNKLAWLDFLRTNILKMIKKNLGNVKKSNRDIRQQNQINKTLSYLTKFEKKKFSKHKFVFKSSKKILFRKKRPK